MRFLGRSVFFLAAGLTVIGCKPNEEQHTPTPTAVTPNAPAAQTRAARERDETVAEEKEAEPAQLDPLGPNAACYVCHMAFVREELSATHLAQKTTCIDCHGLSDAHANDENIGATPPDRPFKRDEVNPFCRTCHATHDVAPEELIARYRERREAAATQPAVPVVCTDCHGEHRIAGG